MDKIKIGDKEYELYFGLNFIRELDKKTEREQGEIQFGLGVGQTYLQLCNYHPVALANCIQAATATSGSPSDSELESYITELYETKKTKEVFGRFLSCLMESPLTSPMLERFRQIGEEEEKKAKEAKAKKSKS